MLRGLGLGCLVPRCALVSRQNLCTRRCAVERWKLKSLVRPCLLASTVGPCARHCVREGLVCEGPGTAVPDRFSLIHSSSTRRCEPKRLLPMRLVRPCPLVRLRSHAHAVVCSIRGGPSLIGHYLFQGRENAVLQGTVCC